MTVRVTQPSLSALLLVSVSLFGPTGCVDREDFQGGTRLEYELDLSRVVDSAAAAREVARVIEERLLAFGVRKFRLRLERDDRLVLEAPDRPGPGLQVVKRCVASGGRLSFHVVMTSPELNSEQRMEQYLRAEKEYDKVEQKWVQETRGWLERGAKAKEAGKPFRERAPEKPGPPEYIVRWEGDYVDKEPGVWKFVPRAKGRRVLGNTEALKVDGSDVSEVYHTVDTDGNPALGFNLRGEGARRFGELTEGNLKSPLAIVVDDDIMQVATIQERISTRGILHGKFTNDEIRRLVAVLRSGALPVRRKLLSETRIPVAKK